MSSVAENLEQMQSLTKTNLQILKAINDSFFTKRDHLVVNIDDNQYVIPSFISLENKVNALQEGLQNIISAPKTGEAHFNFDGNSQAIEVRGFTCTPNSLKLKPVTEYGVESNDIFKDFITPNAYVKLALTGDDCYIPNDITTVNVKKVIAKSDEMKNVFSALIGEGVSSSIAYSDILMRIANYDEDIDYVDYDTVYQLPIRKSIGSGMYVIKSIDKDVIDSDLIERITLTISSSTPLVYKLFDETIEKKLQAGDELVTFDDSAKMRIVEVRSNTNQIVVEVLNGDYLNLVADTGDISKVSDLSKLKFFSPIDFDNDKYIKIPLEEDQYVAVFVAPLNSRMNIQSPWGSGVLFNTHKLLKDDKEFGVYYKENVKNIGDILYELTSIINNSITKYSRDEFTEFANFKPIIDHKSLSVVQINKHLNDSQVVQNIRSLYSQKKQYKVELESVQKSIDNINSTLSSIDFDDTSNIRTIYETQLSEYNKKKTELVTSISSIMNEISISVSDSEVPIESAKYHIRGFYDWMSIDESLLKKEYKDHIQGILVQYRYKNKNKETGNAVTLSSGIYSDWNVMDGFNRHLTPSIVDGTSNYIFTYQDDNSNLNEPSFNQIDIPISQGETVDIRMKVVYDFAYPFAEMTSSWSDIVNIEFPSEFLKDVNIIDIIEENNNEIESNRFESILRNEGITSHIDDKLVDQDITYLHRPEYIASGFYTSERRVIPLKDKLSSMDTDILTLKDTVLGSNTDNLEVSVLSDESEHIVKPNQSNLILLSTDIEDSVVTLQLANKSDSHTINLYSMFPGNRNTEISSNTPSKFTNEDFIDVNIAYNVTYEKEEDNKKTVVSLIITNKEQEGYKPRKQVCNQYIYFRKKDAYTSSDVYSTQTLFPLTYQSREQICIDSDEKFSYLSIKPGEAIQIPVYIDNSIGGKMAFDIRMSLYNDPTTYELEILHSDSDSAKLTTKAIKAKKMSKYRPIV